MLSIIIVNHNSSDVLKECYFSIISTFKEEPFEIFIVDSGSGNEEIDKLMELEKENVRIILNKENIGYAKAVNQGIKSCRGEHILISNPDIIYLSDSIKAMSDIMTTLPKCGGVGPKTWWNKKMDFLLPQSQLITPYRIFLQDLMKTSKAIKKNLLKSWLRSNLTFWLSVKPSRQEMLSGACIMTTRKIIDKVGGFDEIFPLYFEDTDWSLRVRKSGYNLFMIPQAQIIHYYNQSAKKDITSSQQKFNYSLSKYLKKHFQMKSCFFNILTSLLMKKKELVSPSFKDLGTLQSPPSFEFSDSRKKILLLSPLESMIPSSGAFLEGDSFLFPDDLWHCLGEGRYFIRCFYFDSLIDCGSWSWVKASIDNLK